MISAARVLRFESVAQVEQLLEAAAPVGQRALLLQLDFERGHLVLERRVFALARCRRPT